MFINIVDLCHIKFLDCIMKYKYSIWLIISILITALSSCHKEEKPAINLCSRLQEVNRLELARMSIGKVGMISDPEFKDTKTLEAKTYALFNKMKIGTRTGVYSYDTYLTAYIDLGKLTPEDVEHDEENKIIRIWLPPVEIMTDGREPQLHEEHSRVTGLRSQISPKERASLKAQMSREIKREISRDNGVYSLLRKSAETKGKAWLTELLANWGYTAEITFRK